MVDIVLGCCIQGIKEENMKPWKLHWDIQLYKALEHQYQLGLEVLNENLPEIKVELVFRYALWHLHQAFSVISYILVMIHHFLLYGC